MTMQTAPDPRLDFDMADRMRRALRVSGVSVQAMATELQVSRNTVTNWINGHNVPRRRDLAGFALKTGFPHDWLKTGNDDPNLPPSHYMGVVTNLRRPPARTDTSRPRGREAA